jgi:hypothetical protein
MDGLAIFADLHRRGIFSETISDLWRSEARTCGRFRLEEAPRKAHRQAQSLAESNAADAIMPATIAESVPRVGPSNARIRRHVGRSS